jgi:hypothetical protein
MAMPALSTAQITAQLDAVLESNSTAATVAIRAPGPLGWPETIVRKGRTFRLRWCGSRLAMREALLGLDCSTSAAEGLLLLTPLTDNELPDDVAARLFRARIFQPKGWEILRQMFGAQGIDARLVRYDWMPQLLIDSTDGPASGQWPVAFWISTRPGVKCCPDACAWMLPARMPQASCIGLCSRMRRYCLVQYRRGRRQTCSPGWVVMPAWQVA